MCRSQALLLIMALFSFSDAESECDATHLCLTRQSQAILQTMIPGVSGLVKPLEPMHEDKLSGETADMKYVLNNVTLSGMKDCTIELLSLNPKDLAFVYIIHTTRFVITSDYTVSGTLDSHPIDHQGSFQMTLDDYRITFKGKHTQYVDKKDSKLRMHVDHYHVDSETIGKLTVISKSESEEAKEKANSFLKYLENKWGSADRPVPNPLMKIFWTSYIEELIVYLKAYPFDILFPVID